MTGSFRDSELAGWTARADSYDRLFTPISDQAIPPILSRLGDVRGMRVLDVCCGSGRLTVSLRGWALTWKARLCSNQVAKHRPTTLKDFDKVTRRGAIRQRDIRSRRLLFRVINWTTEQRLLSLSRLRGAENISPPSGPRRRVLRIVSSAVAEHGTTRSSFRPHHH